ncbi:hypothetical protein IQ279_03715 [Streptomyces verrucosisporus]|uniref:WXG100 family type VII secretion target n=1 Tax=Streptomyces verrucosisporus TaxID=1695161 RepID=UPI0019D1A251|nr:hypothetical protein [Streptomyces verrucosisporus]MBN3928758.1 hypothetical protein [Streptomyces verrucosisporus]
MATGEFESKSLAALNAMVAKADPGLLTSRGQDLGKAGSDMDGIGSELRTYIDRVEWDGEGGDAFREWGRQFALESMRFAAYVRTLGHHMVNAGQALTEAKAAIPEPELMCYADPEKEKARLESEESKRQEAINQLNRLSSYYRTTGQSLRAAEEPDFKPLPNRYGEDPGTYAPGSVPGSGSQEGSAHRGPGAASGGMASAKSSEGFHSALTADRPVSTADRPNPVAEQPTSMTIDSVASPPASESRSQTGPNPSQPSTGPSSPATPPVAPGGPIHRTGRPLPHITATGQPPGSGGGSGVPPRSSARDGIMGGTPRQAGNQAVGAGNPRGAVGGDRAPLGRPVGGFPGTASGGSPAGRGVYPGRPMAPQQGGATGGSRIGSGRGRTEFTPGGTGLVRGSTASGVAGTGRPTNANSPSRDRRESQNRPDYLTEDEETWTGQRDVVPPVID